MRSGTRAGGFMSTESRQAWQREYNRKQRKLNRRGTLTGNLARSLALTPKGLRAVVLATYPSWATDPLPRGPTPLTDEEIARGE